MNEHEIQLLLEILSKREEKNSLDADGWINEDKIKEIKTRNEFGLLMISHYGKVLHQYTELLQI